MKQALEGKFKVRAVGLQVYADTYDEEGRVKGIHTSQEIMIPEASFFLGLREFLAQLGFGAGLTMPTAKPKEEGDGDRPAS